MTSSAASGFWSMLISSNAIRFDFRNLLARQQSGHQLVVYILIGILAGESAPPRLATVFLRIYLIR